MELKDKIIIKEMTDSDFAFLEEILDIKYRSEAYKIRVKRDIQSWLNIIVKKKLIEIA